MVERVPLEEALRLCEAIRQGRRLKVFTQCWGCATFSQGERAKMCGEVVGCNLVVDRYRREQARRSQA